MASSHVELLKLVIAYTLVGAFVFTVVITCMSLVGWVKFADRSQQKKLFSVVVVEVAVICVGSFSNLLQLNVSQTQTAIQEPLKTELTEQRHTTETVAVRATQAAIDGLRPQAATMARALISAARARGLELRIISGYRSPEQQAELYARGRTTPGPMVTTARVSVHNTGLAFDVAIVRGGRLIFEDQAAYRSLGEVGRQVGLVWGGDRTTVKDYPHFETPDAQQVLREMRQEV